ncbi:MAG: hypothetical protein AB7O26_08900 [Planctomycetaceae bacterium]
MFSPHLEPESHRPPSLPQKTGRPTFYLLALVLAAICMILSGVNAPAQESSSPTITHIQEDWKVEIGTPDPDNEAPQIIVVCTPTGNIHDTHVVFELNHQSLPEYEAGGMQLQRWVGEDPIHIHNHSANGLLSHDSETIQFTMSMRITDAQQLRFEVLNGTSATWGNFGGDGQLRCSAWTPLDNLHAYNSQSSLSQSRVGYASHRVRKLARTAVRYYAGDTLIATDSTERIVHQYTEGD